MASGDPAGDVWVIALGLHEKEGAFIMEIEKKFLVQELPEQLEQYDCVHIEQGYLSDNPVIRIRRAGDTYVLTYKSRVSEYDAASPVCVNQEVELPLTRESYEHLKEKIDGRMVEKTRYRIDYMNRNIELDVFHGIYEGMILAEVEFPTTEDADRFVPPAWFGKNVSGDRKYTNAYLANKSS